LCFDLGELDAYAQRRAAGSHRPMQVPARQPESIPSTGALAAAHHAMAIFALDAAGIITMCHGTCLAALGCSAEAAVGRSIFEIYHTDPQCLDQVYRALAGESVTFVCHLGGSAVEQRLVPQRDGTGTLTGLIGVATDVAATEEALRAKEAAWWHSAARAQALLESVPDAIIAFDQDGRIVLANSQVARLFGYPRQALLGYHVETLFPEGVRSVHIEHRAQDQSVPCPQSIGSGLDLYARRHDGTEFPVEVRLGPLSDGGQHLVTAVIRDISAR
jgi:PAS domain S-box-containing protein